ncbi:MAG: DUF3352 domain-containing protein [Leptolyngbyaceae cyanobacterium]
MVNRSGKPWRYWWLSIVAIAVLLSGASSCGQLPPISGQPSISQANHIVTFVPKQALLSAVVDTTAKLDKARTHTHFSKVVSKNLDLLLVSLSLDFKEDIRPWLGDTLAFAVTDKDIDRDHRNGHQTGYLLVVDAADGDRLREFLELFWQRQTVAGTSPVLSKASGVPIVTAQVGTHEQSLATAVVGQHILLVANDVQVLKQSLRVAQTPTLQLLEYDCCVPAWVSLQLPALIDWLGLAVPVQPQLPSSPQWQQLITTAMFQPHRLVVNTRAKSLHHQTADPIFTANLANTKKTRSVESIESYLPASLVWAAAGYDLRPLWAQLGDELNYYQKLPAPIQQSQQWLSTQLAQILLEPISQLFSNDYAVGQFRDGTWLMAIANSQPANIKQLDDIAIQQGLTVSQFTLKDQSVTAWSRLKTRVKEGANRETTVETELVALHTRAEDCHIFATSIGGLTAALEAPEHPLLDTQRFQQVMQSINNHNQGYLYGTWDEIERLLASDRWFSLVKPIVQPWTESLSAIAVSAHGQPDKQSTGTVSILLKD